MLGALILATTLAAGPDAPTYCIPPRDRHGHIARSGAAKLEFRKHHPCPATGLTRGACPGYVIDHIVPLKRCGPDTPANMQWQTIEDARQKDRWE